MSEFFDKLTPPQLTAVICTVSGVAALVAMITAIWSYQVRALADETALARERQVADIAMQKEQVQADIALKQELVRRNLPAAELKLALEAIESSSPAYDAEDEDGDGGDAAARVLKILGAVGDDVDGEVVEETVALVAATNPAVLPTLADVLEECHGNDQGGETLFAVARAFCKANARRESIDAAFERAVGEK